MLYCFPDQQTEDEDDHDHDHDDDDDEHEKECEHEKERDVRNIGEGVTLTRREEGPIILPIHSGNVQNRDLLGALHLTGFCITAMAKPFPIGLPDHLQDASLRL